MLVYTNEWGRYLVAVAATAVAVVLRWLLAPWMGEHYPFITIFGAVAAAVWYGGWRPAAVASLFGLVACEYLFVGQHGSFDAGDLAGLVMFLLTCSIIIGIGEAMRSAQRRAQEGRELLRTAERALLESEARFRTLADHAPALLWVNTPTGCEHVNRAYLDFLGLTLEQVRGMNWAEYVHPEDREEYTSGYLKALEKRAVFEGQFRFRHASGEYRHLKSVGVPRFSGTGDFLGYVGFSVDITDIKRAEEALRTSEERFRLMADAAPVLIWLSGTDKLCTWFNKAWLDFVGRSMEEELGNGWADNVHPEDFDRCLDTYTAAFDALRPFSMEYRLRRHDGEYRWVLDSGIPRHESGGRFAGYIGSCIDITDRKHAEDDLRGAEQVIRSVVDNVIDAIITIDDRGSVLSFNPAAEKIFGYAGSEIIGRNVKTLMPEPYHREHDGYIANYLRTGEAKIIGIGREVVGRRKDGSTFPMDLAVGEFHVADRRHFTGIVRDITERKRIEAEREKTVERLQLLWEAARVLLTTGEPDAMLRGLFVRLSPHLGLDVYFNYMVKEESAALRLESFAGIPEEEARGLERLEYGQAVCGTVALDRRPMVATSIQQSDDPKLALVKGYGIRAYACHPLMVGDELLGTLSFGSRSKDWFDADELDFLRTICHYVTVAYERAQLIRGLRESDRRKDEFLATLSHELRNPLAPMLNALEILGRGDDDRNFTEQARGMMERQLSQLVRLVDDLLDISRITSGKLQLRKQRVELADVLDMAIETARPRIEASAHEVTIAMPPEPVYVEADPTRLAQAFTNLLNNAAKYTEKGGRIWLTAERRGGEAVVSVRDTGIGIAPDHLPRVFTKFSQAAPALERDHGGLGIGLSIVKGLIDLHGGAIEARSDGRKKGSEFTVRLPVVRAPAGEPATSDESEKVHRVRKFRILVVDDMRDAADSLTLILRMMGHDVITAYDGLEAVQTAAAFRPDVALLDIGLPRMNGYEAARRIREEPGGDKIALIALTGWGQDEDKRRAREAGFDHHLTKPVDPAGLESLLARIAERN